MDGRAGGTAGAASGAEGGAGGTGPTSGSRRRGGWSWREKVKLATQRGRHPRHLAAAGFPLHPHQHLFEHLLQAEARGTHGRQQVLGVGTVAARAVLRDRTRRGGVGNESTHRAIHPRQSPAAEATGKGVVAAGIENHDIETVAGGLHRPQHGVGVHALVRNFEFLANIHADGNQVILALELDPVARVIEQPDAALLAQLLLEIPQRLTHGLAVGVEPLDDLKAQFAQLRRHVAGIVGGIAQWRVAIGAVADHQGGPGFRWRRSSVQPWN